MRAERLKCWTSGVSGRAACTGAAAWDGREVDALGERGDRARLPPEEDAASGEHESSGQSHGLPPNATASPQPPSANFCARSFGVFT